MKHKITTYNLILRILVIQILLLTNLNIPLAFSNLDDDALRMIRGGSSSVSSSGNAPGPFYESIGNESDDTQRELTENAEDGFAQQISEVKEVVLSRLESWIKQDKNLGILTEELEYRVEIISDSLANLSMTYGATQDELMGLLNDVLDNLEVILPSSYGIDLVSSDVSGYIFPWVGVAVEIALREQTNTPSEIHAKLYELFGVITPEVVSDTAVLLEIEQLDLTNPSHVAELAEYARIVVIQDKIGAILNYNFRGSDVEKYQKLAGIMIQIGNWLKVPTDVLLARFSDLVSNIDELERGILSLTGSNDLDHLIPWIAVGINEAVANDIEGSELIQTLLELMQISNNSGIQEYTISRLDTEVIDFKNVDHVLYLALNAGAKLSEAKVLNLLRVNNISVSSLREELSTYLFSIKAIFNMSNTEVIEEIKDSLARVEGLLDGISQLNEEEITMADSRILPWIWLDMVLELDPEAVTTIEDVLSFANTERGQFITSYLIGDTFNPSDPSNVAMFAAARELASLETQGPPAEVLPGDSPISRDEIRAVIADEDVNEVLTGAISNIKEVYQGQEYDEARVKEALAFLTLIDGDPRVIIDNLSDIELMMAKAAASNMSIEEAREAYNEIYDIIRGTRSGNTRQDLPPVVEPGGFDWKSNLMVWASTILALGAANAVFQAGDPVFSNMAYKIWLAFLTYVNLKPMAEFGLSGVASMPVPEKIAPEVSDIVENGVPINHRGALVRQMYVVKEDQLKEDVLLGGWQNLTGKNGNVPLAIVIDVDTEEFREKTEAAYDELIRNHPEYKDQITLFIRNKGNWEFEEAYNRKEGRIDDYLTFIFKGTNFAQTHLGDHSDLRRRNRQGHIRILGDIFYVHKDTGELMSRSGNNRILDQEGNTITEDRIAFEHVYQVKNGKFYDAYGNLIAKENEFELAENEEGKRIVSFVKTPYRTEYIEYRFLLKDGRLYDGDQEVTGGVEFAGDKGQIMFDKYTGQIIRTQDGQIVRGNYIGLDLRRDPLSPMFSVIKGNIDNLYIGDEEKRIKYFFVIDEDTTLPADSITKMIAKFAHPDNAEYVVMQPALKNTNAYDSQFTRADTLAREMLRFSEFFNWRIYGGIMYGKWGARVDDYYDKLIATEVADPTARSEDERPALYVPVLGLPDVFFGDEPKRTFFQFIGRLQEWSIGDWQTLQKEWLPRMLGGIPYKIYSKIFEGVDAQSMPKLSPQGQRMITNLKRSMYMPAAFGALVLSYIAAGNIPGLYTITGRSVSDAMTYAIVFGAIIGMGKFVAPTFRDVSQQVQEEGWSWSVLPTIGNSARRAWVEFIWSTGLFIPFITLKSIINYKAIAETRRADMEARMVPRTPGVIISEMERVENIPESYRKLISAPIVGALAVADLAIVNPVALIGFTPLAYAFLFQPTLAFLTENTTVSLGKAIDGIDGRGGSYGKVGDAIGSVYESMAERTMANEKLNRLLKLELKFENAFKLMEENTAFEFRDMIKDSVWNKLTGEEKEAVLVEFAQNEEIAKSAVFDYLKAIYHQRVRIEEEESLAIQGKADAVKAFKLRAYSRVLIHDNSGSQNLLDAAGEMYELMDDVANVSRIDQIIENLILKYQLSDEQQKQFRYYINLARR